LLIADLVDFFEFSVLSYTVVVLFNAALRGCEEVPMPSRTHNHQFANSLTHQLLVKLCL